MTDIELLVRYARELEKLLSACRAATTLAIDLVSTLTDDSNEKLRISQEVNRHRATAPSDPILISRIRDMVSHEADEVNRPDVLARLTALFATPAGTTDQIKPVAEVVKELTSATEMVDRDGLFFARSTVSKSRSDHDRCDRIHDAINAAEETLEPAVFGLLLLIADEERDIGYRGPVFMFDSDILAELDRPEDVHTIPELRDLQQRAAATGWLEITPAPHGYSGSSYRILKG